MVDTSGNDAFSPLVPGLQIYWDSTSLGAFKRCPRYYFYSIICGYTPRKRSVHLDFGIYLHSARERYYHARATGASHADALDAALSYALCATWNRDFGRPWDSGDSNKNRLTLVRTLVWYLDKWENDPLETIVLASGKPAVELSFSFQTDYKVRLHNAAGTPYQLCGHLDRLAKMHDKVYPSDLKTTKNTLDPNYFAQFTPDSQFSLYSFAAKVVYGEECEGLIVDAAQVAVTFSRFHRAPVLRSPAMLDEWYKDLGDVFERAEKYATEGYWPMNDKACFLCDFRNICSKDPASRELWLKADFERRVWDPTKARGDI